MSNQKIYVQKSKARAQQVSFGQVLKLGFHAESLIDFVKQHTNEKGYINLDVVPRRETDQYGNTHSIQLNDWKPNQSNEQSRKSDTPPLSDSEKDDVPF